MMPGPPEQRNRFLDRFFRGPYRRSRRASLPNIVFLPPHSIPERVDLLVKFAPAASVVPSRIRSIADLADQHPGTLRLFYGEDSLPTPPFIKDAAHRAIEGDMTFYTPNAGYPALRRGIADQVARLHGVELDPMSEVVVTASGMVALLLACQATVGPGDSAVVLTPLWPNVAEAVRLAGARAIEVPLELSEAGFRLNLDWIEAAIEPSTRLLALASPGNPTAWTATLDDWRSLVDLCERRDLWLLADGVYERIVFDGQVAPSPLSIPGARSRTIIAQSFSKAYRMTGWRVGYALAPPELARSMTHLQEFVVSHAAGIAQEAARVALLEGEPFIHESQARYARHRQISLDRFRGMSGVTVPDPTGAFYVFPRLDGLADSMAFCRWLVQEKGVGLAPGNAFGLGGEGHIRLCFAVEEPILREALDRLEEGWIEYRTHKM
jgi:aspartate/methionine/tyrosine aminotransferase